MQDGFRPLSSRGSASKGLSPGSFLEALSIVTQKGTFSKSISEYQNLSNLEAVWKDLSPNNPWP